MVLTMNMAERLNDPITASRIMVTTATATNGSHPRDCSRNGAEARILLS
jgi:hypothetical protein